MSRAQLMSSSIENYAFRQNFSVVQLEQTSPERKMEVQRRENLHLSGTRLAGFFNWIWLSLQRLKNDIMRTMKLDHEDPPIKIFPTELPIKWLDYKISFSIKDLSIWDFLESDSRDYLASTVREASLSVNMKWTSSIDSLQLKTECLRRHEVVRLDLIGRVFDGKFRGC